MTESVIADFRARFLADSSVQREPVTGRVLLSGKRLIFATDQKTRAVPLSGIFDITVGHVPPNVSEFFDDTVTIGYEQDGAQRTSVVEADASVIERFSSILFRATLNGATVTVKHPTRVGGRVVDTQPESGSVKVGDRRVTFTGLSEALSIDLSAVIEFEKGHRTIDGRRQLRLVVRHMAGSRSVTSEFTLPSSRKMNILGRYLRLEYSALMSNVRELDVSDDQMEVLLAVYSGVPADDGGKRLARILDVDAERVHMLLQTLEANGLLAQGEDTTSLTSMGRMTIGDRMEEINV